jgi:hypothetical protein
VPFNIQLICHYLTLHILSLQLVPASWAVSPRPAHQSQSCVLLPKNTTLSILCHLHEVTFLEYLPKAVDLTNSSTLHGMLCYLLSESFPDFHYFQNTEGCWLSSHPIVFSCSLLHLLLSVYGYAFVLECLLSNRDIHDCRDCLVHGTSPCIERKHHEYRRNTWGDSQTVLVQDGVKWETNDFMDVL